MRKWAAGFLVLAAAVLFYVACGDNPASPSSSGPTAKDFGKTGPFGPSSGPFGPSSGPFGPSSSPYGPCTGPFPGPIPDCGGGGGTATPSPTPGGPTATPTKTPTPGGPTATPTPVVPTVCNPTSVTFISFDTPITSNPPLLTSTININDPNLAPCKVTNARVSFHLIGPLASPSAEFSSDLVAAVNSSGNGATPQIFGFFSGTNPNPLSGLELGTSCTDLAFTPGGSTFPPPTPPYVGTFAPIDSFDVVFGAVAGGQVLNGNWQLNFHYDQGTMTLDCWRMDLTLTN
jgi:hypothetical protein